MKKLVCLLCLMLAFSLTACSSKKEEVKEEESTEIEMTDLVGYWTLVDDYNGDYIVYEFQLDETGSWTGLFFDGTENGVYGDATLSDGCIYLTSNYDEEYCYQIASNDELLDDNGDVIYRRTDDVVIQSGDSVDADIDVTGTWYLITDTDTYITLNEDGSCEKCEYGETTTCTYTVTAYDTSAPELEGISIGEDYTSVQVDFDDIFFSNGLTLVADNEAMISASGDEVYIHELEMENPSVNQQAQLVAREFSNDDNSSEQYYFFLNHSVAYISDTMAGAIDHTGTWELDDYGTLTITWETGETKTGEVITNITYDTMSFDGESSTFSNKSIWDY